jgi:nucleotide-binding universal stress UspA family protein
MFTKLLVPLDGSPLAEQAIGQAAAIARASQAEIDVVLVHQPLTFGAFADAPWSADQWNDDHRYLESIVEELVSGSSVSATHAVVRGDTVEMICQRAWDIEADLIVMTSHGRTGLSRAWLGSVADGVLRRSSIPVLVLRPVETKTDRRAAHHLFSRVLIPLDGSTLSTDILSPAFSLARCCGANVTLIRVVQPIPVVTLDAGIPYAFPPVAQDSGATDRLVAEAKQQLDQVANHHAGQGGTTVDTHVVVAGHVAQGIIDFARSHETDVIAMSTHGRGSSRFLMGSVADKVLRGSGLPMLLHRPIDVIENAEALDGSALVRTRSLSPA